VRTLDAPRVRK